MAGVTAAAATARIAACACVDAAVTAVGAGAAVAAGTAVTPGASVITTGAAGTTGTAITAITAGTTGEACLVGLAGVAAVAAVTPGAAVAADTAARAAVTAVTRGAAGAAVTPGAAVAAVVYGDDSYSYRELDEASNRLAHCLVGHRVGAGDVVGLLVERSAKAIIAILAVLKTGAAYLPIDLAHPQARIDFMLADAEPVAVITTAGLADRLAGHDVVVVDIDDPAIDTQPGTGLPAPAADNIAYILYTSGTTGIPKGVATRHCNVTQLFAAPSWLTSAPRQVWSQCHSFGFDTSVLEMWGALLHGGRLVVVSEAVTHSPAELHDLLVAEQVGVICQTPSAAGALSSQGLESATLMVAGEACPADVVDRWAPGRVMVNAYGPTETTMYVTMSAPLAAGRGAPPIGSPAPLAAVFVLDGWLRPVPVGVVGEL